MGRPGGRVEKGFPWGGVGASSCSPPSPRPRSPPFATRRCPEGRAVPSFPAVPTPAGAGGLCPSPGPLVTPPAWLTWGGGGGAHPCPRTLSPCPPPPPLPVAVGGTPVALPPPPLPHRQPRPSLPGGIFCPRWVIPGGNGDPGWLPAPAGTVHGSGLCGEGGVTGGYIPRLPRPPPPHFRLPSMGNRNIPLPQPFPLSPAPANRGVKKGHPNHPWGASHST